MRLTTDVDRGAWIGQRLRGWGNVGGVVPRGFDAYARIFHPVTIRRLDAGVVQEEHLTTWADVARRRDRAVHPAMQWNSIAGEGEVDLGDGWVAYAPFEGELDEPQFGYTLDVLGRYTGHADEVTAGFWSGWGSYRPDWTVVMRPVPRGWRRLLPRRSRRLRRPARASRAGEFPVADVVENGPLLQLPDRDYVLLVGTITDLRDDAWKERLHMQVVFGPALLWPDSHEWCLASEIDFDSTLVGGSRALVDDLLTHSDLEVAEVTEDTDLTIDGDTINGRL